MAVLDTKYKTTAVPKQEDIQQIVAYAVKLGVAEAWLVYPTETIEPIDLQIGHIRVRSGAFDLSGEFEQAGQLLLAKLLALKIN